jgi:hypothetical protein
MQAPLGTGLTLGQSAAESAGTIVGGTLVGGFFGIFFLLGCSVFVGSIAHLVLFITVAIKIISSREMPMVNRVVWGAVAWFVPLVGSILFWVVGAKDNRPMFGQRSDSP